MKPFIYADTAIQHTVVLLIMIFMMVVILSAFGAFDGPQTTQPEAQTERFDEHTPIPFEKIREFEVPGCMDEAWKADKNGQLYKNSVNGVLYRVRDGKDTVYMIVSCKGVQLAVK